MAKGHKEIIMSYDKLSLASFKEALKANKYVSATGARRAVGKATTLSDGDKDKARAAIDAHFGSTPAPAPTPKKAAAKAAPKKAAAAPKKVAAKKAAAAPKKTAAAAKPAATPKKKAASGKKSSARAPQAEAQAVGVLPAIGHIDLENIGSIGTQMKIAEKTIQNVGAALSVLTQAKQQYPEADLAEAVNEMGGTLAGAVGIFRQVVNIITKNGTDAAAEQTAAPPAPAPRQGVVNNGVVPSRAENLFRDSGPEGSEAQQPTV